jgi:hypothetical protein
MAQLDSTDAVAPKAVKESYRSFLERDSLRKAVKAENANTMALLDSTDAPKAAKGSYRSFLERNTNAATVYTPPPIIHATGSLRMTRMPKANSVPVRASQNPTSPPPAMKKPLPKIEKKQRWVGHLGSGVVKGAKREYKRNPATKERQKAKAESKRIRILLRIEKQERKRLATA